MKGRHTWTRSRTHASVGLTREERTALRRILAGSTGKGSLARRARAILLAAGGHNLSSAAQVLKVDRKWVRRWVRRFVEARVEGLRDRRRPGRPRKQQHPDDQTPGGMTR
jgi:hypothetical protein